LPPSHAQFGVDVDDGETGVNPGHEISIFSPRAAVQRQERAGGLLDLPNSLGIEARSASETSIT